MTYIMSCVWLDYMVKYFQCKNCVGSSPKTKKCVASFLVPGDSVTLDSISHWVQRYFYVCSRTRGLRMHIFAARRCMKYIKKDAKLHFYLSDRLVSI